MRTPLSEVLGTLERLVTSAELRPGVEAPAHVKECVCCMDEPRSVRFECGHCVCCKTCADHLVQQRSCCPACRMQPIRFRERGEYLAKEATWAKLPASAG